MYKNSLCDIDLSVFEAKQNSEMLETHPEEDDNDAGVVRISNEIDQVQKRKDQLKKELQQLNDEERQLSTKLRRASRSSVSLAITDEDDQNPGYADPDDSVMAMPKNQSDSTKSRDSNKSGDPISRNNSDPAKRSNSNEARRNKWSLRKKKTGSITEPKSLAQTLKEVQKDPAIQTAFGDQIQGAYKMVYLGTSDVDMKQLDLENIKSREQHVIQNLHKVIVTGQLARKVVLICTDTHLGIVDRAYHDDVIVKYQISEIKFHAMKTIKKATGDVSFIVFYAESKVFKQCNFYALEGKSNWTDEKIHYVYQTISRTIATCNADKLLLQSRIRQNANNTNNDAIDTDNNNGYSTTSEVGAALTRTTKLATIPKDAIVHRIKYIGIEIITKTTQCPTAVVSALLKDSKDMKKHTREKTLQHVIDYAPEAVLVCAPGSGLALVNPNNSEKIADDIVPTFVTSVVLVKLDMLLENDTILSIKERLPEHLRKSPSLHKAKVGLKKSHSNDSDMLEGFENLTLAQRDSVERRISNGELSITEGIAEAKKMKTEIVDHAVCICYNDDFTKTLKAQIVIVKGSASKANKLKADLDELVLLAKTSSADPFAAKTHKAEPLSRTLAEAEVDRNCVMAVKMIGSGMFGEVYLANQHEHTAQGAADDAGTPRAVKTLRKGANRSNRAEFTDEAAIQLEFNHKNLVKVTGVCMTQQPFLCVLEFMQYGDLQKVLRTLKEKDHELEYQEQLYIMMQISNGLKYMHARSYVHMDLATRNVLVGVGTTVKVADFGLTRPYDKGTWGYRLSGKMKLPMLWTSPECFPPIITQGKNVAARGDQIPFYDEKTDMWAFGVSIWEIVTYGKIPYGGGNLIATMRKIHNGLRLEMPADSRKGLVNLVKFAFEEDRNRRPTFQMVSEVLQTEFQRTGHAGVRDIGLLINEGYVLKMTRASTMVSQIRRASSLSRGNLMAVATQVALASQTIHEENEEEEEGTSPKKVSKWKKVRLMMPFFSMSNWALNQNGGVERKTMVLAEPDQTSANPFESDSSDSESESEPIEIMPTQQEEQEEEQQQQQQQPKQPAQTKENMEIVPPNPTTVTIAVVNAVHELPTTDTQQQQPKVAPPGYRYSEDGMLRPIITANLYEDDESDHDADDDDDDDDEDDEDEDDDDDDSGGDEEIFKLMMERREKHAAEEEKRREEIKIAYMKRKAEEDAILMIELAQFDEVKKKEQEILEAEKTKIYNEAQIRLETELDFSFDF